MYVTSNNPESSSQIVKQYRVPFQGTWKTLPAHILPDDVLFESFNVVIRRGRLRARPGLRRFTSTPLFNTPIGSFLYISSLTNSKTPIVGTESNIYRYNGVTWVRFTNNVVLSGTRDNLVRFTSLEADERTYLVGCNGFNTPFIYSEVQSARTLVPTVGAVPIYKDVTTSLGRIVGFVSPYRVRWSNFLNPYAYPEANVAILSDTEDPIVAIRNLGILGLIVYKEGSIYIGSPLGSSDATAFRFDYFGEYEGPAGVNALCRANGAHYYITPTGRIGAFDGANHQWVADSLWPFLREDLDIRYAHRSHCSYDYRNHEIYFFYPRVADGDGSVKGIVILNLPYPTAGINTFATFLGRTGLDVGMSLGVRLFANTASPLVFGKYSGQPSRAFMLDGSYLRDDHLSYQCHFQPGLFQVPNARIAKPFMELYSLRSSTKGSLLISEVTSNILETDGGTTHEGIRLDLTKTPPNEFIGFTEAASYLGFRAEWLSTDGFEYMGADVHARLIT